MGNVEIIKRKRKIDAICPGAKGYKGIEVELPLKKQFIIWRYLFYFDNKWWDQVELGQSLIMAGWWLMVLINNLGRQVGWSCDGSDSILLLLCLLPSIYRHRPHSPFIALRFNQRSQKKVFAVKVIKILQASNCWLLLMLRSWCH